MASLLDRKLIVVTGKGGTGKSTVACALGLLAARRGLRTIVVEVGDQRRIPDLFAAERSRAGDAEAVELQQGLWSTSIDPDRALIEWVQTLTGRTSARLLAASSTFHYFAAAAPGAKELVSVIKLRELCEGRRARAPYDLVVFDAPSTGHALALLNSPRTFATIVRAGPLAEQAQAARELLEDPRRCGYVAVTQATEMAVTETLELAQGLRQNLGRDLDAVLVNATAPQRFTRAELTRIDLLDDGALAHTPARDANAGRAARDARLVHTSVRAARAAYERARAQQSQIARLRRRRSADGMQANVVTIPFVFTPELDLTGVGKIAERLEQKFVR